MATTPLKLAQAERREIRRLLTRATAALKAAQKHHRKGLIAERRKLMKRQATLARRIKRLADEYRSNRKRLREMRPAWEALTREMAALESEVGKLLAREERAKRLVEESRDSRRTAHARRAGLVSAERTADWYSRYLHNVERGTGPSGNPISTSFALAVARHQGWRSKHSPDRAWELLNEVVHDNPFAEAEYFNRQLPSLERRWRREQLAASVPF